MTHTLSYSQYYRNATASLVVYDITSPPEASFEKAKSWVRDLRRQADPSLIVLLVGNKADMEAQRQVPREMAEAYAKEEGLLFAEASAKTGDGVSELFITLGKYPTPSHLPVGPKIGKKAS